MASYLDDIYSRLDTQTQKGLVDEGRLTSVTSNQRGTTVTSNQGSAGLSAQEADQQRTFQKAASQGLDLTQGANALADATQQNLATLVNPFGSAEKADAAKRLYGTQDLQEAFRRQQSVATFEGGSLAGTNTGGGGGSYSPGITSTGTPGGGSSGGGGGGGGGTTAPPAPTGPGAAEGGAADANFGQYTEAEIDAALRGIEAEFGMTREQLLADKSMIGAQYRLLMARMTRARQQAAQAATSDAVSRGIYRSGILGENLADIEQQYGEQEAGARQQQLIQEQNLERQLAFLDQGQAAAGAQAQNQILGQAAATMQQAGVNPTQAGFGTGVAPLPGGAMQVGPTPAPAMTGVGAPAGVIPRTALGPGDISGQAPPAQQLNPYAGYPIVGGYYIDPNTGMAVARVDGV